MPDVILDPDFLNLEDEKLMPNGIYNLRVTDAMWATEEDGVTKKVTKNGEEMVYVLHEFEGHDEAKTLFHTLFIPNEASKKGTKRALKRYLLCFKVPFGAEGFDVSSLPGCEAQVSVSTKRDATYGDKNVLVLPNF